MLRHWSLGLLVPLEQVLVNCGLNIVKTATIWIWLFIPQHLLYQGTDHRVLILANDLINYDTSTRIRELVQIEVMHHFPAILLVDVEREEHFEYDDAQGPDVTVMVGELCGFHFYLVVVQIFGGPSCLLF